jgi:hypothetical protein
VGRWVRDGGFEAYRALICGERVNAETRRRKGAEIF